MKLGSSLRAGKVPRLSDRLAEVCPETALMVASTLGVGAAHNGTIACKSEPGRGAMFKVSLAHL
jgi:hypothetical protein